MRVLDRRGIEYDVSYDAERELYIYVKVFKPLDEAQSAGDVASASTQNHGHAGKGH